MSPTGDADALGKRLVTQNLVDILRSKKWADGMPRIRIATIDLRGACVDVVLVDHDEDAMPYHLVEDYRDGGSTVRAGAIYTRDADSNTPKNGTATPLAAERLWRRHFGLDKAPLKGFRSC